MNQWNTTEQVAEPKPMIQLINVTKTYSNGTKALRNVDLQINEGEFVFIVGASGAGKTTLSKLLLREERATSGKIIVNGFNLTRMMEFRVPKLRRTLGVVFQDFRLLKHMTVYENIAFAMRAVGKRKKEINRTVPDLLKIVHLDGKEDRIPSQLSGGEQQRVALARALANNPGLIIADEPTGNIDPILSREMMGLLVQINEAVGKTVVVITHEKDLVDYYNKRVITLSDGQVVSDRRGGMFHDI